MLHAGRIKTMTTWRANRRTAIAGALGAAIAASAGARGLSAQQPSTPKTASPVASPLAAGSGTPHLVVADAEVNSMYVYSIPDFELKGQLDNVGFGIHGGAFQLEDGRLLFADTLNNEIVALEITDDGRPEIVQRVSADLGGGVAWISANPEVTHAVFGSEFEDAGSQFLNVVDLSSFDNTSFEFTLVEREEIHGWLLGDPLHLYVAIGGQIDSYRLTDLQAGTMEPLSSVAVDLGSHGGATDGKNLRLFYTTEPGAGFDVLDASQDAAAYETQIPWDIDGLDGGRNARPRVLRDGVHIIGVMTPSLNDPSLWAETMVSNHITNMDDLTAVRLPIDEGTFGYRWGLAESIALWAGYNADGAKAYVIDTNPSSDTFGTSIGTVDIAMPSNAATPGEDYAGSEFYIMTAVTPDGAYGFATISGDGLIQALDLNTRTVIAEIEVPSQLAGGGYTTVVQKGIVPADLWGR